MIMFVSRETSLSFFFLLVKLDEEIELLKSAELAKEENAIKTSRVKLIHSMLAIWWSNTFFYC